MAVGIDPDGKYHVCQYQARYAGPYDTMAEAAAEARKRGLGTQLVRLAVGVLPELPELVEDCHARPGECGARIRPSLPVLLSVVSLKASDAAKHIRAAGYSDEDRAALVAAEKRGKGRVTVLRALGVEV